MLNGIPGKDRVNFMSVFQIGVKLIALQGEWMGVVLGRLFDPRSHAKERGELLFCPRRGAKKIQGVWGSLWAVARPYTDRPPFAPAEEGSGTGTHGEAMMLGADAQLPLCIAASSTSGLHAVNQWLAPSYQ